MTFFYLRPKVKSPAHHIVLPAGKAFDRIEEFFTVSNSPSGTPFIPPIHGHTQEGITLDNFSQQDYLPGFCGLPFFSPRFVEAMSDILKNEVEFYPCTLTCEGTPHKFYLARLLNRLQLLDYAASGLGDKPHPNFIRHDLVEDFYLAREEHTLKCYAFVCSTAFKTEITKLGLKVAFEPAPMHTAAT